MHELDKFGEFFVRNFRYKALDNLQSILEHRWKAPRLQELQDRVARMSLEDKRILHDVVDDILTTAMHDLLFAFHEFHDSGKGPDITFDGKAVASMSDGLQGEIFSDDGWIKKYSKHPYNDNI